MRPPVQLSAVPRVRPRAGREMTENNLQQAYLPAGCHILDNAWGTAVRPRSWAASSTTWGSPDTSAP